MINKIPPKDKQQEAMEEAAEKRKIFYDLRPVWADIERLQTNEIPDLQQKMRAGSSNLSQQQAKLEEAQTEIVVLKTEIEAIADLKRQAEELTKLKSEKDKLMSEKSRLESDLEFSGSVRTAEEVQSELETEQMKRLDRNHYSPLIVYSKAIRRDLDRLNGEYRLKQRELQTADNQVRETKSKIQSMKFAVQERERIQSELVKLREESEKLSLELESHKNSAAEQRPAIREAEKQLEKSREHFNACSRKIGDRLQKLQQSMLEINAIELDITRIIQADIAGQLRRCTADIENSTRAISEINANIEANAEQLSNLKKAESEVMVIERAVSDNLKLREYKRTLESVEAEISRHRDKLKSHDRGSVVEQRAKYTVEYERLTEELARLSGETKQMEEQARRFNKELTKDYKDINATFCSQIIKLKTETLANQDLEKYSKALEMAIMKYHTMKMEEINKIIRELWVNTYKGSDIETIEIRSDNENVKGNRVYNYRVVMIKEDTELDMRGRCSAGQKVLAALIIRLALAETFCLNCGILALDEPTTNLDKENSESLAESLAK
ncbi:DNA repair protein rad50 [Irineochytrium annulatum]|nr:DNA repair protein rad50 [Irineochytrium annulatum]